MTGTLLIPARFNGPADSGNGGISAGRVAALLPSDSAVTVTLRAPPPLDVAMQVDDSSPILRVYHADTLVAEAQPAELAAVGHSVPAVSFNEALAAAAHYAGFTSHPFPTCFVCGIHRPYRDGLELLPGPVRGDPHHTAAPFVP